MGAVTTGTVMRNATVKLGTTDYALECTTAKLVPDQEVSTITTLVPGGQVVDAPEPTWTLELEGLQEWAATRLARYLWENAGTIVAFEFAPKAGAVGTVPTWAGEVFLKHTQVGGEQGEWLTTDKISLAVSGQPVPTWPVP